MDIPRNSSLEEIIKLCTDLFFPGGENEAKSVRLKDVHTNVTTFSGKTLDSFGEEFTLWRFCQELKTHPVRVYLVTSVKSDDISSDDEADDENDLPHINITAETSSRSKVVPKSTCSLENIAQPDTPTVSFPGHRKVGGSDREDLYETYVNLLEDSDDAQSDDAPTTDVDAVTTEYQDDLESLPDIHQRVTSLVSSTPFTLIVHRRKILTSTRRAIKSTEFSFWKTPFVTFAGEEAEDNGGPRREFFKLLMGEVLAGGVFQGVQSGMTFTYNLQLLKEQAYKTAGQFLTWSFVNGGPGLAALSPSLFAAMTGKHVNPSDIEHIADPESRGNLIKLQNCKDQQEYEKTVLDISDWLIQEGVGKVFGLQLKQRDELVNDLLMHEVYYRVQPAVNQCIEGLGPLWPEILKNPTATAPLFVTQNNELTLRDMKKLYRINYSPDGSNRHLSEEDTVYSFEIFLQRCAEKSADVSLGQLLEFWTAADKIPPCGFTESLVVDFYTPVTGIRRLPTSHTCGPILWLPRGVEEPDDLQDLIVEAIQNCQGFGKI
ncbi:uncharacterized protein LOC110990165 [Acanthaster planci]|uniref:HECT-type E3 ubiquitin transferase n=1 Tax=Acanthaster planci TaxID=133434 RepID=A0A8B8A033_ACAPL|nr:uncharacterized protein LOC110990165 [Acanthaster planci]